MKSFKDCYTLSNGLKIPCMGFGTYKAKSGDDDAAVIRTAIEAGYRYFDTASLYETERALEKRLRRAALKERISLSSQSSG
jgi:diketogulonate reductase-like aldo/keto reductase